MVRSGECVTVGTTAQEIRQSVLNQRKSQSPLQVQSLSQQILQRFKSLQELQSLFRGKLIAAYLPMPGEPDILAFERLLDEWNCRLCFPRIKNRNEKELELVLSAENCGHRDWKPGAYGILEPPAEIPAIDPSDVELFLVPGVAFGEQGERIGMGAGYYDRLLSQNVSATRLALAFEFQVFKSLPQSSWDQPVHGIITESRLLRCQKL